MTKTGALRMVGVADRDEVRRLSALVDLAQFDEGEPLLERGALLQSIHIGITGSISILRGSTPTVVDAPFVLDVWARERFPLDEAAVHAGEALAVLMVDWRARESLFTPVPHLAMLSRDTERRLRRSVELCNG